MAAFGYKDPITGDEAYDMAEEFVLLMKYLWSETERFDFEGKYYQAYGAMGNAERPARRPRPILMNAGQSGKRTGFRRAPHGLDFYFQSQSRRVSEESRRHPPTRAGLWTKGARGHLRLDVGGRHGPELAKQKYDGIESQIDHELCWPSSTRSASGFAAAPVTMPISRKRSGAASASRRMCRWHSGSPRRASWGATKPVRKSFANFTRQALKAS